MDAATTTGAAVARPAVDIGILAATVVMVMAVEATIAGVAVTATEGHRKQRYYDGICGSH